MLKNIRIEEVQSEAGSRHSHRHRSGGHRDNDPPRRPALTERAMSQASEGSVASSKRSRRSSHSHHGNERGVRSPLRSPVYQSPYVENADISRPDLSRRHTEFPPPQGQYYAPRDHDSYFRPPPPQRTRSSPNFQDDIDMHLAYGDVPPPLPLQAPRSVEKEEELKGLMSKLDVLMIEAQCVQHSATTIMSSLQANPEAMAAVALTLAEISKLLTKMSPGILTAIKGSSPAIFALLASPQFLIAGGVAVGVTIVMFGGYKIIKKIQNDAAERKEANRMEEAMVYDGELSSIETWRRGIAEVESQSVATSVDGEFITPEASRIRKERIRDREREERRPGGTVRARSVAGSESTIRRKDIPPRGSSRRAESVVSHRTESTIKAPTAVKKEVKQIKEKKAKKQSALAVLFKKKEGKSKDDKRERVPSHAPKRLEM